MGETLQSPVPRYDRFDTELSLSKRDRTDGEDADKKNGESADHTFGTQKTERSVVVVPSTHGRRNLETEPAGQTGEEETSKRGKDLFENAIQKGQEQASRKVQRYKTEKMLGRKEREKRIELYRQRVEDATEMIIGKKENIVDSVNKRNFIEGLNMLESMNTSINNYEGKLIDKDIDKLGNIFGETIDIIIQKLDEEITGEHNLFPDYRILLTEMKKSLEQGGTEIWEKAKREVSARKNALNKEEKRARQVVHPFKDYDFQLAGHEYSTGYRTLQTAYQMNAAGRLSDEAYKLMIHSFLNHLTRDGVGTEKLAMIGDDVEKGNFRPDTIVDEELWKGKKAA